MKTVSAIILTYNSERHIENCLNKLCAQTFKDFEVILVDGGSIDETLKIVNTFSQKLDITIYIAPNSSMGEARNFGIKKSTGRYLAFCDSDDEYLDDKLEKQVKFANAINDKHFVVFSNHYNAELGQRNKAFISRDNSRFMRKNLNEVIKWQGCNLSSMLITNDKKNVVYFTEGDGGRYGEDWQYNISLAQNSYRFYHCAGVYSVVNVRPDSHTTLGMQFLMVYYVLFKILDLQKPIVNNLKYRDSLLVLTFPHWVKFFLSYAFCDNKERYRACLNNLAARQSMSYVKIIHFLTRPFLIKSFILQMLKFKRFLYRRRGFLK